MDDKAINKDKQIKENNKKDIKNFFTVKNIVIIILSFILFCSIISYPNTDELENTINNLNSQIVEQNNQISIYEEELKKIQTENQNRLDKLKEENENLQKEKNELKEKNENLENENNQLRSSKQTTTNDNSTTNSTTNNNNNTSNSITTVKQVTTQTNNTSHMVWVGNTGTKYHIQGCRTLKGRRTSNYLSTSYI